MKSMLIIKVDTLGLGTIILNGQDISDQVTAIGFNTAPDELTEATLVMRVDEVYIEAEVEDKHLRVVDHQILADGLFRNAEDI